MSHIESQIGNLFVDLGKIIRREAVDYTTRSVDNVRAALRAIVDCDEFWSDLALQKHYPQAELSPVENRPGNGCADCQYQISGFCTRDDLTRDVKPYVQAGDQPGCPQVVPGWCPLMRHPVKPLPADDCPHCVNNSGCNHCNPSGLPKD